MDFSFRGRKYVCYVEVLVAKSTAKRNHKEKSKISHTMCKKVIKYSIQQQLQ